MRKIALLLLAFAAISACGAREELRPAAGQSLPPQPEQTARAQTPTDLLAIPIVAKPERVDEPLRRSEEREDDRFDLPPPG
jgi:PBP1b-binding outer membrane lipoprotein LpoB